MDRLISEQGRIGLWTAIGSAAVLAVFGLLSGLAPTFAQGDEDVLMPGSSAAVAVTQSGGVTRAKISATIQMRDIEEEKLPRIHSLRARWLSTDVSSDVSRSSFDASGFQLTWAFSTARKQDEFDEGGNFIELSIGHTHSFVNYTNSFLLLLDQGDTDTFGAKSSEDRWDISLTGVSRVVSLMDDKLEVDFLWGVHYLDLHGQIHSDEFILDHNLQKQMLGAEFGARGKIHLLSTESFNVYAFGEYRYTFNLRHDNNDRLEYYPNVPGAPYPIFLDSIGKMQSVAIGVGIGAVDSNLNAEIAFVGEEITSGGTVDDMRSYEGLRFGVTYNF